MSKILHFYNSIGRAGNIILLGLLILSGLLNRIFMVIKYSYLDYLIEVVLIVIAVFIVFKLFNKNIYVINKRSIFKVILIAGILLRILFAVHDFYDRPIQDSDYEKHEKLGMRLATEGEFYDFTGIELRNYRQPGLPGIFALGLIIYNHPVTYSIIMILFSFGVLLSGFYLFSDLNNIASLLSFAYLSISPNMLFMASNSNTQLPFFFFLILLFIVLKKYNGNVFHLILIGVFLAAEMYIRFNFLLILILIPFIIEKHKDKKLTYSLKKLGFIYVSFLVIYFPWIYRNYNIYGTIRLMPTTGLNIYSSTVVKDPKNLGGYNGVPDSLLRRYSKLTEVEFDNSLRNATFDFIKNNPRIYIEGLPFKLIKYSGRQDWTISYFFEYTKYPYASIMEGFFQAIENFFTWIILLYPLMFLLKNKYSTPISVYLLWAYLSYTLALLPLSETRARYNFPYILFPVFASSFFDRRGKKNPELNT